MNNQPFSTYTLSYADTRDCQIHFVRMCYRDLHMIVDVLDEYSRHLQEHIQENPPKNFWSKNQKEELIRKTMEISDKLADAIGLDKTYPKCKKYLEKLQNSRESDIGGDGVSLALSRGR